MRKQKLAIIDLTTGTIETKDIPENMRRDYLGGRGIDMYLLYNYIKPGIDPLGPDNVLTISAGLLGGTPAPSSSRTHVGGKSPLTGLIAGSSMGGYFGPELRFAGFDHLLFKGRAEKPVYLWINDGEMEIHDASRLWGKDTHATQELLKEELDEPEAKVLCIGQAGENLVRFANVRTGLKNAAGRTGMGAVMGSKNLKAVAVRGTLGLELAHPKEALEVFQKKSEQVLDSKATRAIQTYGTMVVFNTSNSSGQIRVRNFQSNVLPKAETLDPEYMHEHFTIGYAGCYGCAIHCRHKYIVPEGPAKGTYSEGPEYTTIGAFGTELGNRRMEMVLRGNHIANKYGFDTLEFGNMAAWAMELYEKGLINDETTGGLKLEWANEEAIFELVEQIVFRKGFGDILAEGPLRAIERLGEETRYYNLNIKGMSNLHSDERPVPVFAAGMALSTRGADHLRSRAVIDLYNLPKDFLKEYYGFDTVNDYSAYETKGKVVWFHETYYPMADCLSICRIATNSFSPNRMGFQDYADLIWTMAGMKFTPAELQQIGERIYTLERLFNIREGAGRKDDYPPERFFVEPTPAGFPKNRNKKLDREKFEMMIDENYEMHGWDKEGVPTKETLERLGLDREPSHRL